ncbi:hypothetical protein AXF42_Ash011602 [Apostasia shenzhenica]|uniref:NAB domain-containing protein n=1 Tax=Apostasia shenzhenica TaxID=1088818 RepID=A0A2I0BB38_9ASPA|nr:hypothetical protein AXF42_Ash011602 [Apostasia shenzhenica]
MENRSNEYKYAAAGSPSLPTVMSQRFQNAVHQKPREQNMADLKIASHSWWFGSHSSAKRSPWLKSTLSELEKKTQGMLNLIECEADSFAKRAEMFYKKRPELVSMIEDFYRSYRSLAEQHDLLKSEPGIRRSPLLSSDSSNQSSTDSTMDFSDSELSEVEDPKEPEETQIEEWLMTEKNVKMVDEKKIEIVDDVVEKMSHEIERLKLENEALKIELEKKDEEKRNVIRQLALPVEILKEENAILKKFIKDSKRWGSIFELKKLKEAFSGTGKFFAISSQFQTKLVAL